MITVEDGLDVEVSSEKLEEAKKYAEIDRDHKRIFDEIYAYLERGWLVFAGGVRLSAARVHPSLQDERGNWDSGVLYGFVLDECAKRSDGLSDLFGVPTLGLYVMADIVGWPVWAVDLSGNFVTISAGTWRRFHDH